MLTDNYSWILDGYLQLDTCWVLTALGNLAKKAYVYNKSQLIFTE